MNPTTDAPAAHAAHSVPSGMARPLFTSQNTASLTPPPTLGPTLVPVAVMVGACALVLTAYLLGSAWLANSALGLPVGAWIVILAAAWTRMLQTPTRRSWLTQRPLVIDRPAVPAASRIWPESDRASTILDAAAKVASTGAALLDDLSGAEGDDAPSERFARIHDAGRWPTRPLRVGLRVPDDEARTIISTPGAAPIQFLPLPVTEPVSTAADGRALDAVVQRRDGVLTIRTTARDGRDAAWYDWAGERPLSYMSVFPVRLDPEQITIGPTFEAHEGPIVRSLIESAAALARHPRRLTLADRLRGRRPLSAATVADSNDLDLDRDVLDVDRCLRYLARTMASNEFGGASAGHTRAAARAVSAWLSTREAGVDEAERVTLMEAAARIAGDEPEVMLRLAASRFSAFHDDSGVEALLHAQHLLREHDPAPTLDHVTFVQSELEHGSLGAMTLGRVAAGICLVCSTAPAEQLPHLREDLLEDMRYSGWLIGADPDRSLLLDVFRVMERGREARTRTLARAA